jgi:hypothetical protein
MMAYSLEEASHVEIEEISHVKQGDSTMENEREVAEMEMFDEEEGIEITDILDIRRHTQKQT